MCYGWNLLTELFSSLADEIIKDRIIMVNNILIEFFFTFYHPCRLLPFFETGIRLQGSLLKFCPHYMSYMPIDKMYLMGVSNKERQDKVLFRLTLDIHVNLA